MARHHRKQLQLGTPRTITGRPKGDDRTPLEGDDVDAAWADAITVEQFASELDQLRHLSRRERRALARARNSR